ncbi:hypothetical protein RS9916_28404 [Synechococcus sp. RS9916]|nr:hypothetical protein RS9916_28404 [Synechococcus sp. RS9916]
MTTDSQSGAEDRLPFKDPQESVPAQAEPIKMASEPAELSLQSPTPGLEEPSRQSLEELLGYLSKGLDVLKGLNLQGFQQIYPAFLAILAAVVTGVLLILAANVLTSMNHLPLVGGLLGGLFELCGLVVVAKFAVSNLLLQKKRADLFLRIAELKKELIGQ